ncbi:GNAT family N-acetyltransferase [Goodfellowiella coeruleoviolacea]|uniref:Ribosomal protein S18 acetylase RimI n=1 Tax=Goodfellowiella coeruleoviolacea TaxID=334858 RepID=A0AAE3GE63_9PSEU|nr:GNAT family N-acetyltransferase [Goodfellowiella coeruleoviolacea]MCP2166622.1 Ribosomal protein S18 acetylase RimI [Goodfellowiella coeruleoviolacea]
MSAAAEPAAAADPAEVVIRRLRAEHAGEALTVQRAAFVDEARRYRTSEIPPLRETLAELRADIDDPAVIPLGAWLGSRLVGSVRGRVSADRMELARLAVAPDTRGRGIARQLVTALLAEVPARVRVVWLVAGGDSEANLAFYRRVGFRPVGERSDVAGVRLVVLEKPVEPGKPVDSTRVVAAG